MPAVSLSDIVAKLAEQPEQARMAWLRHVLVDDAGNTQEHLVQLTLAMARGRGVDVPPEPTTTTS